MVGNWWFSEKVESRPVMASVRRDPSVGSWEKSHWVKA
jgi:hypothetical protein